VQRILLDLSFAGVALHNLADRINFHSSLFSALVAFQDLFSDSDHSVGELLIIASPDSRGFKSPLVNFTFSRPVGFIFSVFSFFILTY